MRLVVNAVGDPVRGRLAESRFVERPFLPGGEHNLYELAFAAAALDYDVELRGWLDRPTFERLAAVVGVEPRVDLPARRPELSEVVVVPEGWRDPLDYVGLILSPARLVLYVLAAPGLFGWPFVASPWQPPDPVTVPLDALARPEHFRGMQAAGFTLVTHSPGIVDAARDADVSCAFVGTGRPAWSPPAMPEKSVDVAAVLDNRWRGLAESVVQQLDGFSVDRIETVANAELIERLSRARVLIWPSRVEGHATIPWEARSVGCVPVALGTNRFAVGLDEAHGAVIVEQLDDLAPAIRAVLGDESRWHVLSQRGRETAPVEVAWEPYLERVRTFLRSADPEEPVPGPLSGIGAALTAWVDERAKSEQEMAERLAVAASDLTEATRSQERMIAEISHWRVVHAALESDNAAVQAELDRLRQENHEFRAEIDALRTDRDRLAHELGALLNRRAVRAVLRAGDAVRPRRG